MRSEFIRFVLLCLLIVLGGCGGGSAGTGTGPVVVVQGLVLDEEGQPVSDATVRILETGAETTTGADGGFELETGTDASSVTLEVSTSTGSATTTIEVPAEGGTVSVTVRVNPLLTEITAESLRVGVKIVGLCDIYFENRRVIRQANPVPGRIQCTARVTVVSGKTPLAHVPIAIQFRRCKDGSPWTTAALGATMTGGNLGVGQVEFPFEDDRDHCVYRIVAPFQVEGLPEIEKVLETLTFQGR